MFYRFNRVGCYNQQKFKFNPETTNKQRNRIKQMDKEAIHKREREREREREGEGEGEGEGERECYGVKKE